MCLQDDIHAQAVQMSEIRLVHCLTGLMCTVVNNIGIYVLFAHAAASSKSKILDLLEYEAAA